MQTETKWHLDEQDFGPLNIQLELCGHDTYRSDYDLKKPILFLIGWSYDFRAWPTSCEQPISVRRTHSLSLWHFS